MRALIDDQEIDVAPDELPAFTFSVEDPEDIGKVRGARSTTMRIPATNRNKRIIGGAATGENSSDSFAFSVRNGTAIYFDGACLVRERSEDGASVVAFGDNAAWIAALKGRRMRDVGLGYAQSQAVNNNNVNTSWDGSKPYVFPLIDYGSLEGRAVNYNVLPAMMHPALFLSKAMTVAFAEVGYGIGAGGSFKAIWDKLIVPPVNGPVYVRQLVGSADPDNPASAEAVVDVSAPAYQPTVFGSTPNVYRYGTAVGGNAQSAIAASGTYTAPTGGLSGSVAASLYYGEDFNPAFDNVTFVAVLWNQTTGQLIQARTLPDVEPSVAQSQVVVFSDVIIPDGNVAFVGIQTMGAAAPAFPNILASASVAWGHVRRNQEIVSGALEIDLAAILPDITTLEMLSWVTKAFCVIPITRGNFVELWRYDELFPQFAQPNPIPLSGRQAGTPVKHTEDVPSAIIFKHDVDKDDRALDAISTDGFDVRFEAGGASEEQEVEVGYSPTAMDTVMGMRIPAMRYRNSEQSGGFYPEWLRHRPRLLLYEGLRPGAWTFNSQALTEYPSAISYGNGSTSFGNVHFNDRPRQAGTVALNWRTRLRRWTSPRLLLDALWADHEIAALRPGVQVMANDGRSDGVYYVLEVNQHRFGMGEPSETTLIPL